MGEEFIGNVELSPVALNLRHFRKLSDLTIKQLSDVTGIEQVKLFYYETDREKPKKKDLRRLAWYYGVNVKRLSGK